MQAHKIGLAALITVAMTPVMALAQQAPDVAADRADAIASRNLDFGAGVGAGGSFSILDSEAQAAKSPHKFSVVLAAPVAYSSNPERASSNTDGDGHVTPTVNIKYEYVNQLGGTFSVSSGGLLDLNLDRQVNDSTILSAGVEYKTAPSPLLAGAAAYINYGFQDIYQKQFGDHVITNHTGAIGLTYKTPDPPKDPNAPPPDPNAAPKTPPIKLTWTLEAARREASLVTGNQNRFRAGGGFEGGIVLDSKKILAWSAGVAVLYKDYSGGAAKTRDDIAYTATGVLIYPISPTLQARLIGQYEHNSSDVAGKDYDVIDVGLQLRAAF